MCARRNIGISRLHFVCFSSHSTRLLAATTLRNVLGTKNLAEILSERETISQVMQNALDEATDPWGVKVIFLHHSVLKSQPSNLYLSFSYRLNGWKCKLFSHLSFHFIFNSFSILQQRCPFASTAAKGHGSGSRGCTRGQS